MSQTIIAIASGKGGTGKTTIATNLASIAAERDQNVQLLDCDVEAPNAHLFLNPVISKREEIYLPVPFVHDELCNACGDCGRICRFSAIVSLKTIPLCFPELCHSCGGCIRVCPTGAITESHRTLGVIEEGLAGNLHYCGGKLRIGEAISPPLIKAVKKKAHTQGLIFIDSPPGTSCPVIEAVHHSTFVVLVTEPTPFGLNDLSLAVETMRELRLPFGIVVNRVLPGRETIRCFCDKEKIDILAEIPEDRGIAESYSQGKMAIRMNREFYNIYSKLLKELESRDELNRSSPRSGI
ncbi:MAG: ATP-binding protein [Planctomycetota bacterium]